MYFQFYQQSFMLNSFPLSSKINPNPDLPAAFIPFFRRIFFMGGGKRIRIKGKITGINCDRRDA